MNPNLTYLRCSIATDMNNLMPTIKVITQRKGHISRCWLFSACNRKFEANFGDVGLSEKAKGAGGVAAGLQ